MTNEPERHFGSVERPTLTCANRRLYIAEIRRPLANRKSRLGKFVFASHFPNWKDLGRTPRSPPVLVTDGSHHGGVGCASSGGHSECLRGFDCSRCEDTIFAAWTGFRWVSIAQMQREALTVSPTKHSPRSRIYHEC